MQSDEELFLNKSDLAQALISKMGVGPENRKGKRSTAQNDEVDVDAGDEAATQTFLKTQSLASVQGATGLYPTCRIDDGRCKV